MSHEECLRKDKFDQIDHDMQKLDTKHKDLAKETIRQGKDIVVHKEKIDNFFTALSGLTTAINSSSEKMSMYEDKALEKLKLLERNQCDFEHRMQDNDEKTNKLIDLKDEGVRKFILWALGIIGLLVPYWITAIGGK